MIIFFLLSTMYDIPFKMALTFFWFLLEKNKKKNSLSLRI